jgi:hypothetical protein
LKTPPKPFRAAVRLNRRYATGRFIVSFRGLKPTAKFGVRYAAFGICPVNFVAPQKLSRSDKMNLAMGFIPWNGIHPTETYPQNPRRVATLPLAS